MSQIALVTHQHDDNVRVGMVAQLLEPPRNVLVCLVLADIVDEQSADGTPVVRGRDGAVPFLAGSVPDLCLDGLGVDLDRPGGKLDADGGLGVYIELISSETAEQVGLSDARVSNQNNCGKAALACIAMGGRRGNECLEVSITLEKKLQGGSRSAPYPGQRRG
jgi:hypothetical protein